MPIRVVCQSCGCKLKAPDDIGDRRAQCPRCGGVMRVGTVTAVTAVPPAKTTPRPRPRPAPARREEAEVGVEEAEVVEAEVVEDDPPEEDEVERADTDTPESEPRRRKRKRKKKKRSRKRATAPIPAWVWWTGGVGGVAVLALAGVVAAVAAGYGDQVLGVGLILAVMLPVSTVILIVSMFISSPLAGGIEFGEPHIVIPKALLLLLVINLIYLVPFGGYLAIPFWVVGLMYLFDLDFWESRFLFAINWILTFVFKMFVLMLVLSALTRGGADRDLKDQPDPEAPAVEQGQETDAPDGQSQPLPRRPRPVSGRRW